MAVQSDVEYFARLVDALEPWLDQVVIIGGWAHRLYRQHPLAQPLAQVEELIALKLAWKSSAEMIFQIGRRRFRSLAVALSIRMPSSASADRSWVMTEARTLRRLPPRAFIGSTAPIRNGAHCFTMVTSRRWDSIAWLDTGYTFSANRSSCWI